MYNYLQAYFFGFLFLHLPLIYGMEITKFVPDKQANKKLLATLENLHNQNYQEDGWNKILECLQSGANVNTALYFMLEKLNSDNPSSFNIQVCKRLLEHKADPNIKIDTRGPYGQTALFFATRYGNSGNLIDLLLKHGAKFTDKEIIQTGWAQFYTCTPLGAAIINNRTSAIQVLCKHEAPLTDIDQYQNTAFHVIADSKKHREYNDAEKNIKTIMTYSHFNPDNKKVVNSDQSLQQKIITALCCFKTLNLHKDMQLRIFANLPEYYIFHGNLRNKLIKSNYQNVHLLTQVHYHVESLKNILQIKNKNWQTALEIYRARGGIGSSDIIKLLSGEKLEKDYTIFIKEFPAIVNSTDDNIVRTIANNYNKLNV